MPTDNFDRAVRARMADTGEPYQTARNALIAADHELVADAAVGLLATVEDHDPTMRVRILTRPGGLARVAVALPHLLDRVHEATWGEWDRGVAHNAVEADDHESVDLIWPAVEVEAWADYLTHGLHALTPGRSASSGSPSLSGSTTGSDSRASSGSASRSGPPRPSTPRTPPTTGSESCCGPTSATGGGSPPNSTARSDVSPTPAST
ncbi:hypothetical protein DVS28_b0615 (plasmid) [Euzebya pacifica]|uniref:Uncharacterized protein n=1 Tax=Euzebya pacifica TaxID=1608957 RepID=A0A346Y7A8_9ACTN|nr:hypothetical protein [Euzebya pacifica]AXV10355.1 hypothetical protein DVS28_b0615 [Euzebya pacifica]